MHSSYFLEAGGGGSVRPAAAAGGGKVTETGLAFADAVGRGRAGGVVVGSGRVVVAVVVVVIGCTLDVGLGGTLFCGGGDMCVCDPVLRTA